MTGPVVVAHVIFKQRPTLGGLASSSLCFILARSRLRLIRSDTVPRRPKGRGRQSSPTFTIH
jgi:hypothetical protein